MYCYSFYLYARTFFNILNDVMKRDTILIGLLILLIGIFMLCNAPRKKMPEVTLLNHQLLWQVTTDSIYVHASLLASDAALIGDTTALAPGIGRFERSLTPDFSQTETTPWQLAVPDNNFRLTGSFARVPVNTPSYIRCVFGSSRSFLQVSPTDTIPTL